MTAHTLGPATVLSSLGAYVRIPVGRQPACRLDAFDDRTCRLVVLTKAGQEKTLFDVPVAEIEHARLRVGQLTVRVRGRRYHIILASPTALARAGMRTMGLSSLHQVGGSSPAAGAGALAGSVVAGMAMARHEKDVDPVGLAWLRHFDAHGVGVEAPSRWKPRVRYMLLGLAVLVTAVGILGSAAGVAEAGGWTGDAPSGVSGMAFLSALAWAFYGVTTWLLWKTVPRDTRRRVRGT